MSKSERKAKSDRRGLRSDDALSVAGKENLPLRVVTKRNDAGEALDSFRVVRASVEVEYECGAFAPVPFLVPPDCDPCDVCGEDDRCIGSVRRRGEVLVLDVDYNGDFD